MIYTWQFSAWDDLVNHWTKLPNAWLLLGKENTGVLDFAYYLGSALICESPKHNQEPCGQCTSCHLFQAKTHPDFLELKPDDEDIQSSTSKKLKQIKVETVRALIEQLHLSSYRGGRRVVLIHPAESMNSQAANALLKILEEPPEDIIFILVSMSRNQLLPTIKSRCRQVVLPAPSYNDSLAFLQRQEIEDAENLLAFYGGAPLFELMPEEDKVREELLELLVQPRLILILDFAAQYDKSKWPISLFLQWIQKWIMDVAAAQQDMPVLYYPQYQDQIILMAHKISQFSLFSLEDDLKKLVPYGQHTLNSKLQIETILIEYLNLTLKS